MIRQAGQTCRGTWRLSVGDGAVLWHRPGCLGAGIMTELIFASGQRSKCGGALASQGSDAHTESDQVLLQTPAAAETADCGVKLSAEASHVVTGIRSASRSHGVRVRCGRSAPGPTAPMAYERHLGVTASGHRPWMARNRSRSHLPEKMLPPRWISPVSRLSATLPSAGKNESTGKNQSRSRVGDASAEVPSPLFRGVTTPDLPEGI